jgi:hypothetical protein
MGEFAAGRVICYLLEILTTTSTCSTGRVGGRTMFKKILFGFLGRVRDRASSLCTVEYGDNIIAGSIARFTFKRRFP